MTLVFSYSFGVMAEWFSLTQAIHNVRGRRRDTSNDGNLIPLLLIRTDTEI
jgi:hypothetical protein